MEVSRQSHRSLIFLAFATEPGVSHISGICDSGSLRESRIGDPERLGASGRGGHANSSDSVPPAEPDLRFQRIPCLRDSPMWLCVSHISSIYGFSVPPGEPRVAPGEPRERFPRILKVFWRAVLGHSRPTQPFRFFRARRLGRSVEPEWKPNI